MPVPFIPGERRGPDTLQVSESESERHNSLSNLQIVMHNQMLKSASRQWFPVYTLTTVATYDSSNQMSHFIKVLRTRQHVI